ncbi:5-amino-6-(5-phospho-D-ribitylamino)uracil phosphatase YcsE [bioreactor metagenome]|uniref:5-amino-6-(5-phospho-D-ribitylamino)uracil phosphatase YcsE n=1 Tax=bioreactor metagenome TaxID=1076179 RepID=A0A645C217_9ZZZZ|nr:HAD family hydrolase [Candidatus Metalachnospira sp.]
MGRVDIIATDLDGTLLTDDKRISDINKKAMFDAAQRGIYIVPATGRALHTMPQNVLELDCVKYAVTSNGAAIVDVKSGETLYKNQMSINTALHVINQSLELGIMVEIFTDGRAYTLKRYIDDLVGFGVNSRFVKWYLDTRNVVDNFSNLLINDATVENINLIFNDLDKRVEMRKWLAAYPEVELTNSLGNNIEVGVKNCGKGAALTVLAEMLGSDMSRVMCLGDNENDIDMLKRAGISIGMSSGQDSVKENVTYVAKGNNDDGFAEAVYKFAIDKML